jgi:hypothetical protein
MCSVSTYIQHQTAVTVSASDDGNRRSSGCKMTTIPEEWTKEVHYVICFYGQKFPPVENHHELVIVYGDNVMAIQHVLKWCREFVSGWINVKDEQWSDWPFIPADPVQDIHTALQADSHVSIAQLES